MAGVRQVHKLSQYKRYLELGSALMTPEDLQILSQAAEKLAPSIPNVDQVALLVLMSVGCLANKLAVTLQDVASALPLPPGHPPGEPPPMPEWAKQVLEGVGLVTPKPLPTGPVDSIEEMHARARAAGLVII